MRVKELTMLSHLLELFDIIDRVIDEQGLNCEKNCGNCCKPSLWEMQPSVSPGERQLIDSFLAENGAPLPPLRQVSCRFLNAENRCIIYPVRPVQCRVFCCNDHKSNEIVNRLVEYNNSYLKAYPSEYRDSKLMCNVIFSEE